MTFAQACEYWAGLDNAPGNLTWAEWKSHGLDPESARLNCMTDAIQIAAILPDLAALERDLTAEEIDRLVFAADQAWGRPLEA